MKKFVFTLFFSLALITAYSQVRLKQFWPQDSVMIYQYNLRLGARTLILDSTEPITGATIMCYSSSSLLTQTFDLNLLAEEEFIQEDSIQWKNTASEWVILEVQKQDSVYWYLNQTTVHGQRTTIKLRVDHVMTSLDQMHRPVTGLALYYYKNRWVLAGNASIKHDSISMSIGNQAYRFKVNKWLFGADFVDNSVLGAKD